VGAQLAALVGLDDLDVVIIDLMREAIRSALRVHQRSSEAIRGPSEVHQRPSEAIKKRTQRPS
jgi:hypothetical protein